MKSICIIILFFIGTAILQAQIVPIPDPNFKDALINHNTVDTTGNGLGDSNADTNNDGEIQVSEALAVPGLIVSYYDIVSLEGIEYFTNLVTLKSRLNLSTEVDLSQNTLLEWLHLSNNPIQQIDVSNNPNLGRLWLGQNELTSMDVSQNPNLYSFRCYANNLSSLNMQNGNNMAIEIFRADDNPNLYCIQVDDEDYANSQVEWLKDKHTVYSEDCSLGVEDLLIDEVIVYPNPVRDVLFIGSRKPIEVLGVYDLKGNRILQLNKDVRQLDLSPFSDGIYFIQIKMESEVIIKKIVKQ